MKICVCGWYFYPEFMRQLKQVSRKYPVGVVAHKRQAIDLPHVYRPNVGLEWGAYNHYLMHLYDGKDKVLFIHDDMEVYDLKFFDDINDSKLDVGFVFRNESESKWAFGAHGRAIIMSEKFLNYTKSKKFKMRVKDSDVHYTQYGFWYDPDNMGNIYDSEDSDPNTGIKRFKAYLEFLKNDIKTDMQFGVECSDKIRMGFRGKCGLSEIQASIKALRSPNLEWADQPQGIF